MNDRAREVLVQAALKGTKQISGKLWDGQNGFCAMGALYSAAGLTPESLYASYLEAEALYEMTREEAVRIIRANDVKGWDFLTIANKFGTGESE